MINGWSVHKSIDETDPQCECVREDFRIVRVRFFEIFRDKNGVGDIRPSGWVMNGRECVVVAAIRFLGCRGDSQFLTNWFNVREFDPLGFVRNPFEIEGISKREGRYHLYAQHGLAEKFLPGFEGIGRPGDTRVVRCYIVENNSHGELLALTLVEGV